MLLFEVVQVRRAESATDGADVELDIFRMPGVRGSQQVAPQLLAGRATKPFPPPDLPDRMQPVIAPPRDRAQPMP